MTSPKRRLLTSAAVSRVLVILLTILASHLPLFDSSPRVLIPESTWASSFLRWDAFFFAGIAKNGYVYEHEWAFFPGTPLIMRYAGKLFSANPWTAALQGGAAVALFCDTTSVLYDLSLHHLHSEKLAFVATLLSLLPSSPATLRFAPYTEPFFTYLSYRGMLECTKSRWFLAACYFSLAGTFRSNGILLSGFIIWGLLVDPFLTRKQLAIRSVPYTTLLTVITFIPFVTYQYMAYRAFCLDTETPATWCSNFPPAIYTHVQAKYWNVGFLRYWTLSQLPNFILAAPVIMLLSYFSLRHITQHLLSKWKPTSITPHAIHALILTATLVFASHTQIILRLAASMPFTYWSAAWLLVERPGWGKWWVGWSVIWGSVSLVLWATFLPPA